MVKILLIVPYENLGVYARNYISRIEVSDIEFRLEDIYGTDVPEMKDYEPDIIVARGLSSEIFRYEKKEAQHIEIPVTSYDVLNAINDLTRMYRVKKIAAVWTGEIQLDLIEEILKINICQYKIKKGTDAEGILDRIEADGADAVIGGLTIGRFAKRRGIPFLPIMTTEETLRRAIDEAVNMASGINAEKQKASLMRMILDHSKEAVCVVDSSGKLLEMNKQFFRTFDVPYREGELKLNEALGDDKWWEERLPKPNDESLQKIQNRLVLVTSAVVQEGDSSNMYLLSFQDSEEIRNTEYKIRSRLKEKGLVAKYRFENILGHSQVMRDAIRKAQKFSKYDSNMLILGESGTGKELFAQSVHNASERCRGPFVAINCAAIPEQLLESELFGYSEGSFTGAAKGGKAGLFEQAHKGTLFLDEIGEMSVNLQAKLLRALQENEVRRLGDGKVIPIDVRVICATNVNVEEMIKERKFRLDLYYRINVFSVTIPPLRERREDIPELFHAFFNRYARKMGTRRKFQITEEAQSLLKSSDWPGNVRELQNFSERAAVLCEGSLVDEKLIKLAGLDNKAGQNLWDSSHKEEKTGEMTYDQESLIRALTQKPETKSELAERLGISRATLYRRLKKLQEEEKK